MNRVLYKFGPIRDEYFENRLVRITPRTALNDPYEFYPVEADLNRMRNTIPTMPVGKFNIHDSFLIDGHFNCMGVISFTESIDNFLMWSHYGDEHRGVAIEYDANHDFFKDARPVDYSEKRVKEIAFKETQGELVFCDDVFFKKSKDWIYENEWRIADSLITCDCLIKEVNIDGKSEKNYEWHPNRVDQYPWEKPGLYMKQIPSEAIRSITFGCRVSQDEMIRICNIINNKPEISHMKKYKIKLDLNEYKYIFEEISL
ncbi:DUF2971 domain-containing protein [Acinetobacter chinensis]|uniref:DUF2971 domain-containing protein n=1 Tax=Acinetobacter chinensis TaxID=2004650 RepID=A0ABU3WGF3_9GAMM|nr:DUF2971 domain-containing protein [Acinetobacter chinensis]MDV2468927.1 DUF2971 domain-containing protein [Acinetobacter chinensis]